MISNESFLQTKLKDLSVWREKITKVRRNFYNVKWKTLKFGDKGRSKIRFRKLQRQQGLGELKIKQNKI